jgi:hypothetical protein
MPNICFSYSADLPLGAGNRNATQQTLRDTKLCFSYSGDMPLGVRSRGATQPTPRDLSSTPGEHPDYTYSACFSYVSTTCFRY